MASHRSVSKRYDNKPFLYWWDVWDGRKEAIADAGKLILVQGDTALKATVAAAQLLPLLTEGRRTSRGCNKGGRGNWGVYVRRGSPGEVEVAGSHGTSARLKVRWR